MIHCFFLFKSMQNLGTCLLASGATCTHTKLTPVNSTSSSHLTLSIFDALHSIAMCSMRFRAQKTPFSESVTGGVITHTLVVSMTPL